MHWDGEETLLRKTIFEVCADLTVYVLAGASDVIGGENDRFDSYIYSYRGVEQSGSSSESCSEGRRFKSSPRNFSHIQQNCQGSEKVNALEF